jgi:aminopeptidase N
MRQVPSVCSIAAVSACSIAAAAALAGCPSGAAPPPPVEEPAPRREVVDPFAAGDLPPTPPALKLGGEVVPRRATLELTIDPAQTTFTGRITIDATVTVASPVVWLNATDLTITSAALGGEPARVIPGGPDFVGLALPRDVLPGALTIDVHYTGGIDHSRSRGIYAEQDGDAWYAYTFFQSIDARRAFPCFDQPDAKIPWKLIFHVKKHHVALANAAVERETDEADGMKRVELAESRPMPSYLVAFVVGPFDVVDGGTAGRVKTPIRFVVPPGHRDELRYALAITPKVVTALEDYFDMEYPYGKLDVAVPPRYWGTMEHPGIVAMGQPLTLIKPTEETRDRKEAYANILAHELAHYWYGDLVTLAWWDDTWLNESLGTWLDAVITDQVEPTWNFLDIGPGRAAGALAADEQVSTKPIRQPVETKEAIESSFDGAITYMKGQSVLRMFESFVGHDAWRDFMRAYVVKFSWKNADAEDFYAVMAEMIGEPTAAAFRTFIEQPGAPLVTHKLVCDGTPRLELHQRRAFPAGTTEPTARTWQVPVCARYGTGKTAHRSCVLLTAADGALPLDGGCPTWLTTNAGGVGYYRSSYTAAEIKPLLGPRSPLTMPERAALLADLGAEIGRDELALGDAMALAPLVLADPDDRIRAGAIGLTGPLRVGELDDATHAKYKKWVLATFGPAARKLGWRRKPGDSDDRQRLRVALVGAVTWAGDRKLAAEALALTKAWLANPAAVEDDAVDSIVFNAVRVGDAALFDAVLAAAKAAKDRTLQARLVVMLGGFDDAALIQRALDLVLAGEFDLRDSKNILFVAGTLRETRELVWRWIEAHAAELVGKVRSDEATWFIQAGVGSTCTTAARDRARAILEPLVDAIEGARYGFDHGLESSAQCIAQQARLVPSVTKFLAKY